MYHTHTHTRVCVYIYIYITCFLLLIMCVSVRDRLHKGAHLAIYMVACKDSCLCCISCILEGKFSKEFQMRSLATKPCTAPQLQANSPPLKKCHLYTRGQVDFKNVILTLHEKHKKSVSYGAWEAQFSFLQHLYSKTTTFFRHLYRRWVSEMTICASHAA